MKIWHITDGFDTVCNAPVTVIAQGVIGYYIDGGPGVLKAIPLDLVTAKLYSNSNDLLPSIITYLPEHPEIERVDFTLADLFKVIH